MTEEKDHKTQQF